MSSKAVSRRRQIRRTRERPSLRAAPSPRARKTLYLVVGIVCLLVALWCGAGFISNTSQTQTKSEVLVPVAAQPIPTETISGKSKASSSDGFEAKVNQGNALLKEGKADEAVRLLTEAVKLNLKDEDVHYNLALAMTKAGDLGKAIDQYNEALRIFPNYVEAHNNLGNVLMRTGRTDEAITHFEAAIKLMPHYAVAHNGLGTALQRAGRGEEAITHFERAAQINPDYWQARFNYGMSCQQAGKLTEARTELQAVLRLRPDFEPAKDALRELEARQTVSAR